MAALRYAARKLLLQRTQASVVSSPTVERRLVPRLIHTGSSSPGAPNSCLTKDKLPKTHTGLPVSSSASGAPNYDTAKTLKIQEELQKKKQELYDLLAEVERGRYYMLTSRVAIERSRNVKLLQSLSVEVEPMPSDPKWRYYRNRHILHGLMICTASIIIAYEGWFMLDEGVKQVQYLNAKVISLGKLVRRRITSLDFFEKANNE